MTYAHGGYNAAGYGGMEFKKANPAPTFNEAFGLGDSARPAAAPSLKPTTTLTSLLERLRVAEAHAQDVSVGLTRVLDGLHGATPRQASPSLNAEPMPDGLLPDFDEVLSRLERRLSSLLQETGVIHRSLGL